MDDVINIPNIGIQRIGIHEIAIPNITYTVPVYSPPPVTINIGVPIVDMPGCVKFHPDAKKNREQPNLKEEDSQGTRVLCDADYPTYDAMDYTPEDLLIYRETPPPPVEPPPDPPGAPEVPETGEVAGETECPAPNQPRIGDVAQNQKEKVSGYELRDGICVILYEDIGILEQYLPSAQVVVTTGGIAVVATTSALLAKPLADLLLKVVKPVVKKLISSIKKKLGQEERRLSSSEIQTIEYRRRKGLSPLKRKKN